MFLGIIFFNSNNQSKLFVQHDDVKYWESLIQGDEQAFAKLYEQYFQVLYNYGRKICVDEGTVEDAIHDLFVDLWRYKSNLSPTTSVRFYLYRALRRRLAEKNTKIFFNEDDKLVLADVFQHVTPSKEFEIIETETHNKRVLQLKRLLNDLSPRQYEALVLYFYDEFSYDEIASIMNLNSQSVRNLVQRGLTQLRQYVKYIVSISLMWFLNL